jgi:hypothetical protein
MVTENYNPIHQVTLTRDFSKSTSECVKFLCDFHSCQECTLVLYCSEACRQDSWKQYHQWECHGGLELLHSIGIAHLGLRVVLKAGPLSKLKGSYVKLQKSASQLHDTYGDKQDNYTAVYQLMPHLEDMQHEDLFQYTMVQLLELPYNSLPLLHRQK